MKKRLLYMPGIWSLGLLLPLCGWHLYRQGVWKQERCITMTFPIPTDQRDEHDNWLRLAPRELRQEWIDLRCDGRQAEIDATMLSFRDSLRELESRGDTVRGIHVRFGPNTKYATIIDAIEICSGTVRAWELDDHDLWTLHYPEPEPEKAKATNNVFYLDCGMGNRIVRTEPTTSHKMVTVSEGIWNAFIRPYWIPWCLLFLIGVLALRSSLRVSF